jgi:hypothetical protein
MKKCRFMAGLTLSTCGVATMLMVAAGTLQHLGINGRLSLPAVGICMIIGLMLLGGGFGIMATSSATFDDHEFDRLMEAGNLPVVTPQDESRGFEILQHTNADEHVLNDLLPTHEPQAELTKLACKNGDVRVQKPTSHSVPTPQTTA